MGFTGCIGELWKEVKEKYRNEYLRRLAILYHIRELYVKEEAALAKDSCAFKEDAWLKELADLYILLEMYKELDEDFARKVKLRRMRFIEKLQQEKKTSIIIDEDDGYQD